MPMPSNTFSQILKKLEHPKFPHGALIALLDSFSTANSQTQLLASLRQWFSGSDVKERLGLNNGQLQLSVSNVVELGQRALLIVLRNQLMRSASNSAEDHVEFADGFAGLVKRTDDVSLNDLVSFVNQHRQLIGLSHDLPPVNSAPLDYRRSLRSLLYSVLSSGVHAHLNATRQYLENPSARTFGEVLPANLEFLSDDDAINDSAYVFFMVEFVQAFAQKGFQAQDPAALATLYALMHGLDIAESRDSAASRLTALSQDELTKLFGFKIPANRLGLVSHIATHIVDVYRDRYQQLEHGIEHNGCYDNMTEVRLKQVLMLPKPIMAMLVDDEARMLDDLSSNIDRLAEQLQALRSGDDTNAASSRGQIAQIAEECMRQFGTLLNAIAGRYRAMDPSRPDARIQDARFETLCNAFALRSSFFETLNRLYSHSPHDSSLAIDTKIQFMVMAQQTDAHWQSLLDHADLASNGDLLYIQSNGPIVPSSPAHFEQLMAAMKADPGVVQVTPPTPVSGSSNVLASQIQLADTNAVVSMEYHANPTGRSSMIAKGTSFDALAHAWALAHQTHFRQTGELNHRNFQLRLSNDGLQLGRAGKNSALTALEKQEFLVAIDNAFNKVFGDRYKGRMATELDQCDLLPGQRKQTWRTRAPRTETSTGASQTSSTMPAASRGGSAVFQPSSAVSNEPTEQGDEHLSLRALDV